jgi:hypothetical protein
MLSVQVDAKPLRAELVPITAAALERIKLLLLNMARQVSRTSTHKLSIHSSCMLAHTCTIPIFGYMATATCTVWGCCLLRSADTLLVLIIS